MNEKNDYYLLMLPPLLMILLLIPAVFFIVGGGSMRAPSDYTGVVTDAEIDRGIVFRTSQARMKTSPQSSNFEEFCIPEEMEDRFRELARGQDRVTVTYSRPLFVSPFDCRQSLSIVRNVTEVNSQNE